jgi:hypothetical protein
MSLPVTTTMNNWAGMKKVFDMLILMMGMNFMFLKSFVNNLGIINRLQRGNYPKRGIVWQ